MLFRSAAADSAQDALEAAEWRCQQAERDLADAKYTMVGSRADLLISAAAVAYTTGAIPPQARP